MNSDTIQLKNKIYPLISYAYPELSAGFFGSEKASLKIFSGT